MVTFGSNVTHSVVVTVTKRKSPLTGNCNGTSVAG